MTLTAHTAVIGGERSKDLDLSELFGLLNNDYGDSLCFSQAPPDHRDEIIELMVVVPCTTGNPYRKWQRIEVWGVEPTRNQAATLSSWGFGETIAKWNADCTTVRPDVGSLVEVLYVRDDWWLCSPLCVLGFRCLFLFLVSAKWKVGTTLNLIHPVD